MESPYDPAGLAGMEAYVEELRATFQRVQDEGPALHERAKNLQVTEKSADGLISATVGARGDLIRLDIDPRVYRRPDARHLADSVTETIHRAADQARRQVVEIFEPLIPREQMEAHLDGDLDRVMTQMATQLREGGAIPGA
ncbi:hypothetical protein Sru01_33370 [Sphaerisporangium rufum]|uniref:YbaB/EbfC family DNA-binding protein n=1 Tax=Sphaerisporangium rufum TaxID=1381558 RepID=A0A919R4V8_9ACTN|nr:YbaB/EbfC family nucleoid-associated protein [Sphaerisporangium rufum]GII78355.1 hypothetical protein Sru01_33370 [Sphaerisporangium rufum]